MSLATYADLKSATKNWLGRGTELDTYLDDIIAVAERRIYRELRIRPMETSFSTAMSSGVLALPTSYVALKFAYVSATPTIILERKSPEWVYSNYPTRSTGSKPKYIARSGSTFIFGPFPDQDYTIAGIYYKRLDPIATTVSSIFTDSPDIYVFAACVEAGRFLKSSDTMNKFEPMY
ncbi:MAG TPA: hypothetical protein VE177_08120 [Candidatus Binatus sp.]|nr:hypothetical protein [Candidatus Binatus sp.]